jgi:lysophospholipase L1-like esterase
MPRLSIVCIALLLTTVALQAAEWLPGYTNTGSWVKGQLDEQVADAQATEARKVRLVFFGDSITHHWRRHEALWNEAFGRWSPLNLGIGADNTEQMRWRLANGAKYGLEPNGLNPQVVVLMAGTNNLKGTPERRADDIRLLLNDVQRRWPTAIVLLMSITPRGKGPEDKAYVGYQDTNPLIKKLADGKHVIWCDLNALMTWDGNNSKGVSKDFVHFNDDGYRMWADLLTPILKKMLR